MKKFILFALLALLLPSSAWSYDVGEIFTANIGTEESPYYMRFQRINDYYGIPQCIVYGEEGYPAIDPERAGQNGDGVLTIPEEVDNITISNIGSYAFASCTGLSGDLVIITSVVINSRALGNRIIIITIGKYAFYNCTSLQQVISYGNYVDLEDHVFEGCSNLERFSCKIGDIPSYAFANCSSLKTIETEHYKELSAIEECAFYNCYFSHYGLLYP